MPRPSVAEPQVRFFTKMPEGYHFVPKGDVYVTSNVRKRTHAIDATLFVVVDKNKKPIGLRCPTSVYHEVTAAAAESASRRAAAVQNRDVAIEREFEAELLRLYPKVPRQDLTKILKQALEKRSRRVGRTSTLSLEAKAHLAVKAYIRHTHTPYEQLLKGGAKREQARQKVTQALKEVARLWMGDGRCIALKTQRNKKNRKRKIRKSEPVPRKKRATSRPSESSALLGLRTAESEGDVGDGSGAEESDGFSVFDDDSEDSDWTP